MTTAARPMGRLPFARLAPVAMACALAACAGAELPEPNSDNKVFFTDAPGRTLAVGWQSDVLLAGPAVRAAGCDGPNGECRYKTTALKLLEISATMDEGMEVQGFGDFRWFENQGGRAVLMPLAPGSHRLQAHTEIGGTPASDTFSVRAEEVARVALRLVTPEALPWTRAQLCGEGRPFAMVTATLEGVRVEAFAIKYGAGGQALTGYGQLAARSVPQEALRLVLPETEQVDRVEGTGWELLQRAQAGAFWVEPLQYGAARLEATAGQEAQELLFAQPGQVDDARAHIFALSPAGQRVGQAAELELERTYELAVFPVVGGVPVCLGELRLEKVSQTPNQCTFVSMGHGLDQTLRTHASGECRVELRLPEARGGQGLAWQLTVPVEYSSTGEQPQ